MSDVSLPLAGLVVLDLTRVIAGPVCGRTLAAHGAEVMLVTAGHLPSVPLLVMDTGRGKLSAALDLRRAEEAGRKTEAEAAKSAADGRSGSYLAAQGRLRGELREAVRRQIAHVPALFELRERHGRVKVVEAFHART